MTVTMSLVSEFAGYVLENHLDEFARKYLERVRRMDVPLMKLFAHLPDDQLIQMSKKGLSEFLESIRNGTVAERMAKNLRDWEEDKLEGGIPQSAIQPADILLINRAQSVSLLQFIPRFTPDSEEAMAIVEEMSGYYSKAQEQGFAVYQRIRENYEAELAKSEERFRLTVENVREYAIFRLDTQGYVRSWNLGAQRLKGYTEEEIIGKHFSVFYPEEEMTQGKADRELEIALKEGSYEEEGWRVRKDGSRFWASVVLTPIFNAKREHIGFVKVTRDQTERMEHIKALERKNDEMASYIADIEQFAYISSHDLKEPLRMVATYMQLLQEQYKDDPNPKTREYRQFVVEGVKRMYSLLNDLVAYTSIRKEQAAQEPVNMEIVLAEVRERLAEEIGQSKAEITSDPLPVIDASPKLMVILMKNLVGNALKFRKKDVTPRVAITVGKSEDGWTFCVKDNGIGIDAHYHERIFVIFKRLHQRDEYPGTGMGLAICKKIVELYGGHIWLESEKGEGSTFCFTLPAGE